MSDNDDDLRIQVFLWLKWRSEENGGVFDWQELASGFRYKGQVVTLVGNTGIWVPKGLDVPISITTSNDGPYDDGFTAEGFLDYRYRGTDPEHWQNRALRRAFQQRRPMVYFHSIRPGRYQAIWPVFILHDDPLGLRVRVAIDPAYGDLSIASRVSFDESFRKADSEIGVRRYVTALTKQRLHQSAFREFVLDAYSRQCTICKLQHSELLDAAHIISDSEADGLPIVQNGLSLCKIHHAAYDRNILGISPDYVVRIREDILEEVDGPMLKYGLQSMEGSKLNLPKRKSDYPDRDRLDRRFQRFVS